MNEPTGRVLTCVYCGHEYPQDTPAHGHDVLTQHIATCEKHPMRAVIAQRDRLRKALEDLVGASTREELDALEFGVRATSRGIPDADVAAALNGIHALRDTLPGVRS